MKHLLSRYLGLTWLIGFVLAGSAILFHAHSVDSEHTSTASAPIFRTLGPVEAGTFKNIEDVKAGDRVWSYDTSARTWQPNPVVTSIIRDYRGEIVTVTVADRPIVSTADHPYWVTIGRNLNARPVALHVPAEEREAALGGRWVDARHLEVGDSVVLRTGNSALVQMVTIQRNAHNTVYNLEVSNLHTYAVGEIGVAVHNCPVNCFVAGTQVLLANGLTKPIEEIDIDDVVVVRDPLHGDSASAASVSGLIHDHANSFVHLTVEKLSTRAEGTVISTCYHPFWTRQRGWTFAKDLVVGDTVEGRDGSSSKIIATVTDRCQQNTFNLSINGVHTYFIVANGIEILVHNSPILYRPMVPAPDGGPTIGTQDNMLGARPVDLTYPPGMTAEDGMVAPGNGISVNLKPKGMPKKMRPPEFGGISDETKMFQFDTKDLPDTLKYFPGSKGHGVISTAETTLEMDYQSALASTQKNWIASFPPSVPGF